MSSNDSNPWAGSYAPKSNQPCPSTPLVRTFTTANQSVSSGESSYISERQKLLPNAWTDWLGDASQLGYNLTQFIEDDAMPRVGLACSGGGFRASLFCAGILNAYDARNETAQKKGTGGLLQVSSYLAGVSGGSWVASSLAYNSFPPLHSLVLGDSARGLPGWLLDLDIATPAGINILNTDNQHYYGSVLSSVYAKADSGFDTSITDPWARLISFHFLNGTTRDNFFTNSSSHGAGLLWSDLPSTQALSSFEMPLPIAVMNSQPGTETGPTNRPPLRSVVYEATPFEMGSFDPSLSSMMNVKYVGTKLARGQPDNGTACVEEFDQASFVIGSASSLFNIALDRAASVIDGFDDGVGKAIVQLLDRLIAKFTSRRDDVANWPNPFNGIAPDTYLDSNQTWLNIVDGGENAANVPIEQLLVKPRQVDVVVAIDTTGETTLNTKKNWPNGTAIRTSRERITTLLSTTHQGFAPVPDDFATTGVNLRTTFFGCEPSNPPEFPLVVYVPNSPPFGGGDPVTNTGSFKTSYSVKHQELFFDQTFDMASAGFMKGTNDADPDFPKCLQCAVIDRARYRVRTPSTSPGQSTVPGSSTSPSSTSSPSSALSTAASPSPLVVRQTPSPSQAPAAPSGDPLPRSSFCSQCFQKYCFDPSHPPSNADLPNRKFDFVSPDPPSTLSKAEDFIKQHGVQLAIGLGVGIIVSIIACAVFAIVRRRRRIKRQRAAKMANVTYVPIYDDADAWDEDGRMSYEQRVSDAAGDHYNSSQQYEMTGMAGAADTRSGYNDPYQDDSPPVTATQLNTPHAGPVGSLPVGAAAPVVVAQHHHDTSGGGGGSVGN